MKKLLILMLLALSLNASFIKEEDKQKHYAYSAVIAAVSSGYFVNQGYSKFESFLYGAGTALAVGVAKELYDEHKHGGFSGEDVVADLLGASSGAFVSVQFEWKF